MTSQRVLDWNDAELIAIVMKLGKMGFLSGSSRDQNGSFYIWFSDGEISSGQLKTIADINTFAQRVPGYFDL